MEFFSHHESDTKCRRHHILHCILHATFQIATLATVLITLSEVEKLNSSVKKLNRRK